MQENWIGNIPEQIKIQLESSFDDLIGRKR